MRRRKRHQQRGHHRQPRISIVYHADIRVAAENIIKTLDDLIEVLREQDATGKTL